MAVDTTHERPQNGPLLFPAKQSLAICIADCPIKHIIHLGRSRCRAEGFTNGVQGRCCFPIVAAQVERSIAASLTQPVERTTLRAGHVSFADVHLGHQLGKTALHCHCSNQWNIHSVRGLHPASHSRLLIHMHEDSGCGTVVPAIECTALALIALGCPVAVPLLLLVREGLPAPCQHGKIHAGIVSPAVQWCTPPLLDHELM